MIPSFNIQPGESSTSTAERRRIAQALMKQGMDASPVQHWSQAVARAMAGAMGGYELRRADEQEKAAGKKLADFFTPEMAAATPAAPASATSAVQRVAAAMPASASPSITSPQSVSWTPDARGVQTNETPDSGPVSTQQSPLDPVPGAITPDRARLIAAIQAGESGGKPNVMYGGKTFDSYADHPRQPQPIMSGPNAGKVSTAAGLNQMIAPTWDRAQKALGLTDFSPGNQNAAAAHIAGEDYQKRTGGNLDLALSEAGNDPAKIAAIGKALAPTWTSLPGGIEPNSQTNQFVRNMQAPATDMSAQARQPAAQPSAAVPPAAAPAAARNAPSIPPELQARLRALIMDPSTREYGLQIAQQYMKPSQATFGVIGKDEFNKEQYGWIDPLKQSVTPAQGAATPTATQGERAIPQAPPGVDPKIWRDEQSKRKVSDAMPASWDDTAKLRGEVRQLPSYKNLAEATPIYKTMLDSAGRNTKASDLNLVYGLGKIFDPGSVVREGEMVMVKSTASLPDWLVGTINALNGGAALQPETREAIMKEAFSRIQSYKQTFDHDAGQYRGIAERNRMNPMDVMPDFGEFKPWTRPLVQSPAPVAAPSAAPSAPASIDLLLKKYGQR